MISCVLATFVIVYYGVSPNLEHLGSDIATSQHIASEHV